jgi:hypothetical protein
MILYADASEKDRPAFYGCVNHMLYRRNGR